MIDWSKMLDDKFGNDEEINSLEERSFYGKITINFFAGKIVDINKYETRKPILK